MNERNERDDEVARLEEGQRFFDNFALTRLPAVMTHEQMRERNRQFWENSEAAQEHATHT